MPLARGLMESTSPGPSSHRSGVNTPSGSGTSSRNSSSVSSCGADTME